MVVREINKVRFAVEPSFANKILLNDETFKMMNEPSSVLLDDLSEFIENRSDKAIPLSLHWHMTTRCNFSCPFCYIRNNNHLEDYSYDTVVPILNSMIEKGLLKATLSGGECLIATDFIKIYRHLKSSGVFVSVYTNGSLFDDRILETFKELPPFSVEITFYDCDFSSLPFKNAELLLSNGINVIGKCTVTNKNAPIFENIHRWCKDRNVELKVETDLFDGNNTTDVSSFLINDTLLEKFDNIRFSEYIKETPKKVKPKIGFYCHAAKTCIHLSPDLELSLCYKMKKAWSLKEQIFEEAYNALQSYIDGLKNTKLNGCNGCEAAFLCKVCLAVAEQRQDEFGTSYHVPQGYCKKIKGRYTAALQGCEKTL